MYSTLVPRAGLPTNLQTFPERAGGPHFSGAPSAVLNPGPSGDAGMSVFGSKPSGELLASAADDALYAEQVAPVTKAFAVYTAIADATKVLPKGTVVMISSDGIDTAIDGVLAMKKKADRAGLTLKRMVCMHCTDNLGSTTTKEEGIVGVLAEAVVIYKKKYAVVTVAFENAIELSPAFLTQKKSAAGQAAAIEHILPGQMIRLATHEGAVYRKATVLTGWRRDQEVGPLVCLHPGMFKV